MSNNVLNGEKREICFFFSRRAGAATEIPVLGTIPGGAALAVFLMFGEILYAVLLCAAMAKAAKRLEEELLLKEWREQRRAMVDEVLMVKSEAYDGAM